MSFKVILLCYTIDSFRISVANSNKLMILISEKSTKNQEEQKLTRQITWWCGYIEIVGDYVKDSELKTVSLLLLETA